MKTPLIASTEFCNSHSPPPSWQLIPAGQMQRRRKNNKSKTQLNTVVKDCKIAEIELGIILHENTRVI
jgi:hypothetical protein